MNRRGFIGGTTVAAILGISPYSSPWAEWARIVGLVPDDDDSERFALGRDLEAGLALAFRRKTGLWIGGAQAEIHHPRFPMMVGHIDGLAYDGLRINADVSDAVSIVEHKTQFGPAWDEVPAHYQAQAQFYMWLTGLERCWFSVLFSGFRYEVYELKADRADQALIAWRAWRFWHDHCVTGTPPATDGSDATLRAIAAVYPDHVEGKTIELDDFAQSVLTRWLIAKQTARREDLMAKECEAALKTILGDAEEGTIDGERVVTWRQQTRAGHHVAESTFRVLRPVKPKENRSP